LAASNPLPLRGSRSGVKPISIISGENLQEVKDLLPGESPLEMEEFQPELESIFVRLLKKFSPSTGIPKLLVKADDIAKPTFYVYTGGIPTYNELGQAEVYSIFQSFLNVMFRNNIPGFMSTSLFLAKVYEQYVVQNYISSKGFGEIHNKSGVAFGNGFVFIKKGASKMKLLSYDESVFVQNLQSEDSFKDPIIEGGEIKLSESTRQLLEVMTDGCELKLNVLRGFIRNVICAAEDGSSWQSAVFLYGAPATGKSMWGELVKSLLAPAFYTEFSKDQGKFSAVQLEFAKLLVVSDLDYITKEQKQTLKAVLGRDAVCVEHKYKDGQLTIKPSCQVLLMSNKAPHVFKELLTDKAFMDKIIPVHFHFEEKMQIPPALRIPNLRELFKPYLPEIFVWAMTAPKELLRFSVRAELYQSFIKHANVNGNGLPETQVGFPSYIQERLWFDTNSVTPVNELKTDLESYAAMTGDDAFLKNSVKGKSGNYIGGALASNCKEVFGESSVNCSRSTVNIGGVRPLVLHKVRLKRKGEFEGTGGSAFTSESHPFSVKLGEQVTLPQPFQASDEINWLSAESAVVEDFSKRILENRKAIASNLELEAEKEKQGRNKNHVTNPEGVKPNARGEEEVKVLRDFDFGG
jgi:hypothetical protein